MPAPQHPTSRRDLLVASIAAAVSAATCGGAPAKARSAGAGSDQATDAPGRTLPLPDRPRGARTGSQFVDRAVAVGAAEREALIVEEILSGNVPAFQRSLVPVDITAGGASARVFVMPDYLAIGTDADWVRVPMTIRSAKRVARGARCVLPTTKVVDEIHRAARHRVSSPYMPPGRDMASVDYFVAHHAAVEERRLRAGARLGELISGPKKDIVLSRRALDAPRRTAIYGWFTDDGRVIQGLSLLHDDRYVDYAHGVRLVLDVVEVGGRDVGFLDALADKALSGCLSDEGTFDLRLLWERGW